MIGEQGKEKMHNNFSHSSVQGARYTFSSGVVYPQLATNVTISMTPTQVIIFELITISSGNLLQKKNNNKWKLCVRDHSDKFCLLSFSSVFVHIELFIINFHRNDVGAN